MSEDEWRFWGKVDISDSCWIWRSAFSQTGYGLVRWQGKTKLAHRVAYALAYECILLDNQQVLHTCDTPACVNPYHLFIGTHQDNQNDKQSKNRRRGGGRRLTWTDIRKIRQRYIKVV
jgi:hypothetical protein